MLSCTFRNARCTLAFAWLNSHPIDVMPKQTWQHLKGMFTRAFFPYLRCSHKRLCVFLLCHALYSGSIACNTHISSIVFKRRRVWHSFRTCFQCGKAAKYCCPKCSTRSCSLPCVKQHKKKEECDGVRNKAAFVSLADFTDLNLLSGAYSFSRLCSSGFRI